MQMRAIETEEQKYSQDPEDCSQDYKFLHAEGLGVIFWPEISDEPLTVRDDIFNKYSMSDAYDRLTPLEVAVAFVLIVTEHLLLFH